MFILTKDGTRLNLSMCGGYSAFRSWDHPPYEGGLSKNEIRVYWPQNKHTVLASDLTDEQAVDYLDLLDGFIGSGASMVSAEMLRETAVSLSLEKKVRPRVYD